MKAKLNYHVGVYAAQDLRKGTVLADAHLVCRQPLKSLDLYFTGLELDVLVGKRLEHDVDAEALIPRKAVRS